MTKISHETRRLQRRSSRGPVRPQRVSMLAVPELLARREYPSSGLLAVVGKAGQERPPDNSKSSPRQHLPGL